MSNFMQRYYGKDVIILLDEYDTPMLSDLNNLKIVTTTSERFATAFGFTEEEVFQALDDTGFGEEKQGVKAWYDGFTFGSHSDIYNPWSIVSFIDSGGAYDTYWADTSGNGLINSLIQQGYVLVKSAMEELLNSRLWTTELDE